jgi:hypothetical protein
MNTSDLCIPAAALSESDEGGETMAPEQGDTVEVTIGGRVTRAEGGNIYIRPETANGQPIKPAGGETYDEDDEMRREIGAMGGSAGGALLALLILLVFSGTADAQALRFAGARATSGGAVSNWVGSVVRQNNAITVRFTNAPGVGNTLLMNDRTVIWTNDTPGGATHIQRGSTAALSAEALFNYASLRPFSNIVSFAVQDGTNVVFVSATRTTGTEPQMWGTNSSAGQTNWAVANATNTIGSASQVHSVEINNFSGSTLYLMIFDSETNKTANATPHFTAVPITTGSVGGKDWGDAGAPFNYGVNVCLSTTPFSLTNASAGGTATIIYTQK